MSGGLRVRKRIDYSRYNDTGSMSDKEPEDVPAELMEDIAEDGSSGVGGAMSKDVTAEQPEKSVLGNELPAQSVQQALVNIQLTLAEEKKLSDDLQARIGLERKRLELAVVRRQNKV